MSKNTHPHRDSHVVCASHLLRCKIKYIDLNISTKEVNKVVTVIHSEIPAQVSRRRGVHMQ